MALRGDAYKVPAARITRRALAWTGRSRGSRAWTGGDYALALGEVFGRFARVQGFAVDEAT